MPSPMERREDALREALTENSNETLRWNAYKQENATAIENLGRFAKNLTVDVMVPIGRKAFVPGQLIHTNEVLVGHFQGYFSKCSAHKAQEICRLRLNMANERLTKLEKEAELWQNKLEKPYVDGVLPAADQQDIVEFVSEEEHNNWVEKHKLMVKKHKEQERAARVGKMEKDTSEMDEAALLAELGDDFEQLNVNEVNDEVLTKLLRGKKTMNIDSNLKSDKLDKELLDQNKPKCDDIIKMLEEMERVENEKQELENVEIDSSANEMVHRMMSGSLVLSEKNKRKELAKKHVADNDSLRSKENTLMTANEQTSTKNVIFETLEEVETVREEASLLPLADQVGFYEFQIQIMQQKSKKLDRNKPNYNEERLRLMDVVVSLTEDLENLQDIICMVDEEIDEEIYEDEVVESVKNAEASKNEENKKNDRRISFALSEEMLEFRKNETVADMLPKPQENKQASRSKRDIIALDEPFVSKPNPMSAEPTMHTAEFRKKRILDKVSQNLEYVEQNQSVHDVDLVNKILDASESRSKTLYVRFKHSMNEPSDLSVDGEVPGNPADFYAQYLKSKIDQTSKEPVYSNAYKGEDEVKTPLLSETKRGEAFEDPRTAFSTPGALRSGSVTTETTLPQTKSILRNKSAVKRETHLDNVKPTNKTTKQQRKKRNEDSTYDISAYYKVMNEVTERKISEPDPLPNGKFIDANAPKKRVSRFKQQRALTAHSAKP